MVSKLIYQQLVHRASGKLCYWMVLSFVKFRWCQRKSINLSMMDWWNDTDKGNPKYTEETMAMPLCPTKFHKDGPRIVHRSRWRLAGN